MAALFQTLKSLYFRLSIFIRSNLLDRRRVDDQAWKHWFANLEQSQGIFFILSGIPIDDTGGGARCTQITLELLRQNYQVVFINRYPNFESVEIDAGIRHPNLIAIPLSQFSIRRFVHSYPDRLKQKPIGVLIEFPLGNFLPIISRLKEFGSVTIYDLLDAWDTALGALWYSRKKEQAIIEASDILVATAPLLVERLQLMSGRPVELLPNAANLRLFDPHKTYPRPADMPSAEWSMIYFGALWGEWFDWQLVISAAHRYPSANVILIGDYRQQCPEKLPNLHFLGLKPQSDLPAYLAHSDVAILPWKVSPITLAVSPIKVYEFLAMRKPVVVPDLPFLHTFPFVLCSKDTDHFLANLEQAHSLSQAAKVGGQELENFLLSNSWQGRVTKLTSFLP
jgi:glycosyltransferase involved in cell wall biosynthesis